MISLRLNLRLKLVPVAKFCSSDVTTGAQMPAGDRNAAICLEKERDGEIGVICEWGNKGKGCFNQERGLSSYPEFI